MLEKARKAAYDLLGSRTRIPSEDINMSNDTYDLLKFILTIALPGFSALYVALAGIWNWPYPDQIAGTIAAIVTFGNAVLKYLSNRYFHDQEGTETE